MSIRLGHLWRLDSLSILFVVQQRPFTFLRYPTPPLATELLYTAGASLPPTPSTLAFSDPIIDDISIRLSTRSTLPPSAPILSTPTHPLKLPFCIIFPTTYYCLYARHLIRRTRARLRDWNTMDTLYPLDFLIFCFCSSTCYLALLLSMLLLPCL